MSTDHQIINELKVDNIFFDFIDKEVCNGIDISAIDFFNHYQKYSINIRIKI